MQYSTLFKVAWRGLVRERRRSLVTGFAVILGLGILIFSHHLSDSSYRHLLSQGIATQAGHVLIERQADLKAKQSTLWLTQGQKIVTALRQHLATHFVVSSASPSKENHKNTHANTHNTTSTESKKDKNKSLDAHSSPTLHIVPRIKVSGMLQSPTATARVMALGIEPQLESKVSQWHTQLVDAPLPSDEEGKALTSHWLDGDDVQGILLGVPLARQLDVTVGDKVVMTYQGKKEIESFLFRVRGVISTGATGPDSMLAITTIKGFQKAFDEPSVLHQITFHLSDLKALATLHTQVKDFLQTPSMQSLLADNPYEVKDWKQAIPALYQFTLKDRQSAMAVFIVIAIIIMIGVLNTITMSVLERTRSFGVMLAIGIGPRSVGGLILAESCLLGFLASLLGIAMGALFTWPLIEYGIDFADLVGDQVQLEGVSFAVRLFAHWDWSAALTFACYSWVLTCCAGLWPAWRASRIAPTVALQQH